MKSIIPIICLVLIISSCKTKTVIEPVQEEKPLSLDAKKANNTAESGKTGIDERMRRPKIDPEQIVAQLGLTESQEKRFLEYWEKNQADIDKLRKESTGDRSTMRTQLKGLRENGRKEVEKILTPEQLLAYKKILAKDRMKSRRGQ